MTQALLRWAEEQRQARMEDWASGKFTAAFETEMLVKNAGATGYCNALQDLITMEAEELFEVSNGK